MLDPDQDIRSEAFAYVARVTRGGEGVITWRELSAFSYHGRRVPLVSQQGIFKPAAMQFPISIRTTYRAPGEPRPYEDAEDEDGYLLYRYRGTDPNHYDNRWLREAGDRGIPLLYFLGVAPGTYQANTALIVEDRPTDLTFLVELLPVVSALNVSMGALNLDAQARRHYLTIAKKRAGQEVFRRSVLAAYRHRCSLCLLRHTELLDAAHIILDSEGGPLTIPNGLSMCKIHHAAYDANIVGVRPDHVVEVRADILEEVDGPMLRHGLQALHGQRLTLPRQPVNRPDHAYLEQRYERFRSAS